MDNTLKSGHRTVQALCKLDSGVFESPYVVSYRSYFSSRHLKQSTV